MRAGCHHDANPNRQPLSHPSVGHFHRCALFAEFVFLIPFFVALGATGRALRALSHVNDFRREPQFVVRTLPMADTCGTDGGGLELDVDVSRRHCV